MSRVESLEVLYSPKEIKVIQRFDERCAVCHLPFVTVHHILPRSAGKESDSIKNLAPLCAECHLKVHREGAYTWVERLQELVREHARISRRAGREI